jgi:signal transduction histidine kinase
MLRDENLSSTSLRAGATLQHSAERMKILIDDLFAFTRTRLGSSLPIEPTPQKFDRLCHSAVDEVRAANSEVPIDVRLSGDLSGCWDAARVNQLVVNLLTNAVRYGAGGIRLEAESDGEQIVLAVTNAGSPIPARALGTLFDPLTRARARETVPAGVGLGLYICRVIAEGHNGTISVESNQETVFTVQLPRFPPQNVSGVGVDLAGGSIRND